MLYFSTFIKDIVAVFFYVYTTVNYSRLMNIKLGLILVFLYGGYS